MAARCPLVELGGKRRADGRNVKNYLLALPTIHVHGPQDPGFRYAAEDPDTQTITQVFGRYGDDHSIPRHTTDSYSSVSVARTIDLLPPGKRGISS